MEHYITGTDAIDIARLTGLQLHRHPAKLDAEPDTDWRTAEFLTQSGTSADEFFIDLARLSTQDNINIIVSLIGFWKASKDYAA